jgi:hypothetical protein
LVNHRTIRITFAVILVLIGLIGGTFWQNRPIGWGEERQLTQGSGDFRLVDLATDPRGNAVHLTWEEDTRDNTTKIYYKRSPDGGVTWGPDIRLSNLTAGEPEPRIGTDGRTVLVFFSNWTSTGEHIFYVSGPSDGTNFSRPLQLTNDMGHQSNVAVAFTGPTIHLVYQDNFNSSDERIFYIKSPDAGLTWQQKVALTDTIGAQDRYLAISALENKVFVTWCRLYQHEEAIYVRASLDSGASWKPEIQVSDYGPPSYEDFPDVASNGTQVHIVWSSQGIQYSQSSDSGSTWSGPIPLTNATRQYLAPRLTVLNSRVQVVAAAILTITSLPRNTVDSDVYYLNSEDAGQTWTKPFSLTSHKLGALSLAPVIRSLEDATYVAWEDNRNGRLAIFFLSKPDFAILRRFEWQLFASITITLVVTNIMYLGLEFRTLRTHRRRVGRQGRIRRNKVVKKHIRASRRCAKI